MENLKSSPEKPNAHSDFACDWQIQILFDSLVEQCFEWSSSSAIRICPQKKESAFSWLRYKGGGGGSGNVSSVFNPFHMGSKL